MSASQTFEVDYQNLKQTVTVLEQRVAILENRLDADSEDAQQQRAPFPEIKGLENDIVRITKKLFPGEVVIQVTNDPEYPQDSYTVVHAQAVGEVEEIEDRRIQWHERIIQLSKNCRLLRLSLNYQS